MQFSATTIHKQKNCMILRLKSARGGLIFQIRVYKYTRAIPNSKTQPTVNVKHYIRKRQRCGKIDCACSQGFRKSDCKQYNNLHLPIAVPTYAYSFSVQNRVEQKSQASDFLCTYMYINIFVLLLFFLHCFSFVCFIFISNVVQKVM